MATEGDGKKLCDLRVVDLRAELEKRGLDKTGVKANLIERLQKALQSEGENPDEYEFDLSDKKTPVKRLSTSTNEQNDANVEQAGNDSSVLMIETPFLETSDINIEGANENETVKKCENISSESPLNLSIEEEEEHMLLNSGDEHDTTTESVRKDTDEKSTTNAGASSDSAKDLASTTTKENDEEKEEDEEEEDDGNTDEVQVTNHDENVATSGSKTEDTTSMTETGGSTAAPAPEMSNSTAVASDKDSSKNDKDKNNKNGKSNPGRSLWVTNLLPSTRAQELKHLLSRFGKVIGAKVVQSSRYPRTRCYGYVTMETRAAADLCIEKLNNTELKGQIIRVAKVRPEHSLPLKTTQKKPESTDKSKKKTPPKQMKSSSVDDKSSSGDKRKASSVSTNDKRTKDDKAKKDNNNKDCERESRNASRSSSARKDRSLSKSSGRRPERKTDILTFDKIREERERQRQRERERALREEEKRRRELQRTREIEKRQREEAMRLEREREKLRVERERLDRQRVEIMRLERERQRLEREKLEQEKQELRRQQMRLEEARRPVKRPSSSSTSNYRRENASSYNDDRKRLVTERHYEETPPPPRFEVSSREPAPEISIKKDISKDYKSRMAYSKRSEEYAKRTSEFKREYPPAERHSSGHPSHMVHSIANSGTSSKYESSAYVKREREIREPGGRREAIVPNVPPPRISKDARYNERGGERSPVPYRTVRDERERRPVSDHHTKSDIRSSREHRYADNAGGTVKDGTRYRDSGSQWHSNSSSPVKPFSGMSGSTNSSRDSWSKADTWRPMESSSNDRWGNSSSRIILSNSSGVPNAMYAGGNSNMSGMGAGMSCPPPPGNSNYSMDRFDNYKSITSSRKY